MNLLVLARGRNRPIIAYTRIWYTGTSFCSKVLQPFPRSHPNPTPLVVVFFSANISLRCSDDLNACDRLRCEDKECLKGQVTLRQIQANAAFIIFIIKYSS